MLQKWILGLGMAAGATGAAAQGMMEFQITVPYRNAQELQTLLAAFPALNVQHTTSSVRLPANTSDIQVLQQSGFQIRERSEITPLSAGATHVLPGNLPAGATQTYSLRLPTQATSVKVRLTGEDGDADLYIGQGFIPTQDDFTCRPYRTGSDELCIIENDGGDTPLFVVVRADTAVHGVKIAIGN
ncbi:PPC domain-containing protein [Tahibacter amnicola]|uniref:PPC domain-containing protein n=1 Tax=Tahibacter amnicola TaxID=2976241 RepID=A0ABY6BK74_9GAMM|nr:PPC domain-containing protein [Tahibacter amnicola]UXI70260.1 PPC domain-containing protein [Tahibacter amnicola]